ncbi:MAG: hypothetical protein LUD72_11180 [Bacteroidales bacterium]|nr:hypothetical protein [Bacteroidales bacterium]
MDIIIQQGSQIYGYWEVTIYEEDINEFLWLDKTFLLKLKEIQTLLAGELPPI